MVFGSQEWFKQLMEAAGIEPASTYITAAKLFVLKIYCPSLNFFASTNN